MKKLIGWSSIFFIFYFNLFAQINWEWQNPLPQGNVLFSVKLINPETAIAAGGAGLVMKTTNDGNTWSTKFHVGDNMFWFKDVSFPTPMTGYIVGRADVLTDSSIIMRTEDGGLTWVQQFVVGLPERSLNGVCFVNADTGWAVGTQGRILRTINGGQFWEDQSSPSFGLDLEKVYFTDARNGWAVGSQGSIIRTTNSGETWGLVYWNENFNFYSAQFIDSLTGYVGGVPGQLFRTTNGGINWAPVPIPIGGLIGGIHFFNAEVGVVAGIRGNVFRTTNAGVNWMQVYQMGYDDLLLGLSFINESDGIAVGQRGAIIKTYDGGLTWIKKSTEITDIVAFWGAYLLTPEIGIALGDEGDIYRTSNSGATWELVSYGTTPVFREAAFVNSTTGVAVGRYGVILRTTDSGIHWSPPQVNQATEQLFDVKFFTQTFGMAVGENTIVKTTDAGNTWIAQTYSGASWVMGVYFLDSLNGFTADYGGMIKRTTDGGNSWTTVTTLTGAPLRQIDFANPLIGVIAGGLGTIARTTDGGNTWNIVRQTSSAMAEELYDVQFADENTAYAVGPYGIIKSTDGGANWFREMSGAHWLTGIHFYNSETGMAVGYNGAIIRTNASTAPVFHTNTVEILFEPIVIGATSFDTLVVYNNGNAQLVISDIESTCSNFSIEPNAATILPAQSFQFLVSFTPDSIKNYTGFLVFNHNGLSSPDTIGVRGDGVTTVETIEPGVPDDFALYNNYPNPFNPETTIRFDIPKETYVTLSVYNILGQKVITLIDEELKAGRYSTVLNASDYPSGIYFYQLTAGKYSAIKKGVLLK